VPMRLLRIPAPKPEKQVWFVVVLHRENGRAGKIVHVKKLAARLASPQITTSGLRIAPAS
jgi:hypothetical protein